ncbi:MAG: hypothetical protein IKQ46_18075 [Bacteroidales bacterium]|nr:hypothetical protein [Bacteroidales bacterium]
MKKKTGIIMGIKEYRATGGNAALLKDYHHKSDSQAQWQINFLPYEKQIYAFDYLGSGNHGIFYDSEYYPSVNGYDFRYKSVECFKTDKVIVDFGSYLEIETYKLSYDIFGKRNKKSALFKSLEFSPSDNISLFNALDNHLYSNLAQFYWRC